MAEPQLDPTDNEPGSVSPTDFKELGDRMKRYESEGLKLERLDPTKPYIVRLDGHKFSTLTKKFVKPYDVAFGEVMKETASDMFDAHRPCAVGYCQSDEITLVFLPQEVNESGRMLFGGRVTKIATTMAGQCSVYFNEALRRHVTTEAHEAQIGNGYFDARVFQPPSIEECYANLRWRVADCRRNAISALARAHFTDKDLHGKHCGDMLKMLTDKNVRFDTQDQHFCYGSIFKLKLEPHTAYIPKLDKEVSFERSVVVMRSGKLLLTRELTTEIITSKHV